MSMLTTARCVRCAVSILTKTKHPLQVTRRHMWVQKTIDVKLRTDWGHHKSGNVIKVKPGYMRQTLHPNGIALYYLKDAFSDPASHRKTPSIQTSMRQLGLTSVAIPSNQIAEIHATFESHSTPATTPNPWNDHILQQLDEFFSRRNTMEEPMVKIAKQATNNMLYGSVQAREIITLMVEAINQEFSCQDDDQRAMISTKDFVVQQWTKVDHSQGLEVTRGIKEVGDYIATVIATNHRSRGREWTLPFRIEGSVVGKEL